MSKSKIITALNKFDSPNPIVSYSSNLAKRLDRKLTLTSVAKVPILTGATGVAGAGLPRVEAAHIDNLKANREIELNRLCLEAKKIWINTDFDVEVGFTETTLIKKADDETPFIFLIEGNNELTTMGEWFGTYETRIAEETSVPTLVVPSTQFWRPVNGILYIMEMNDRKARNVRMLQNIAKELDAMVHVMLVAEENTKESNAEFLRVKEALKSFFPYERVQYLFASGLESAGEIKRMTDNLMIDWLAFEHTEQSFIDRVFTNYNSERLILQSEIPVLVF